MNETCGIPRDIRKRNWMKLDTKISKVLRLLIEAEDILSELDDYQMCNDQTYPFFEDYDLRLQCLIEGLTKCIDENKEALIIDDDVEEYYNKK